MNNRVKCFLIERTNQAAYKLRRYSASDKEKCVSKCGYHQAHSPVIATTDEDLTKDYICTNPPEEPALSDPRWPTKCDACDYQFKAEDNRQVWGDSLYRHSETGEIKARDEWGPGAILHAFWADWMSYNPDKKAYQCILPNGHDWLIDGRCSNCTRKGEPHECWVRHGVAPNFTIDKAGNTCAAGAGSILSGNYHGFLRNGYLEEC